MGTVTRDVYDWNIGMDLPCAPRDIPAGWRGRSQVDVRNEGADRRSILYVQQLDRLGTRGCYQHFVASFFERLDQQRLDQRLVLDNEHHERRLAGEAFRHG